MTEEAPKASWSVETAKRLLTAVPLVPFIIWMLYWGPPAGFAAFIAIGVVIVANELFSMMIPESRGLRWLGIAGSLLVALAVAVGRESPLGGEGALLASLAFLLLGTLAAGMVVPDPIETAATRAAWLFGGPIYIGGSLGHLIRLHHEPNGAGFVVMAMMLAWFSDTAAYFAGKFFGRHKLYPKLSPKKTVEGAIGGLLGSVGGGLFGHFVLVPNLPLLDAVVLALVAGAVGQAGDLFESLLKRSSGVKDSGSLLPGHGGLFDRVDALMYTVVFTSFYATVILPLRR